MRGRSSINTSRTLYLSISRVSEGRGGEDGGARNIEAIRGNLNQRFFVVATRIAKNNGRRAWRSILLLDLGVDGGGKLELKPPEAPALQSN